MGEKWWSLDTTIPGQQGPTERGRLVQPGKRNNSRGKGTRAAPDIQEKNTETETKKIKKNYPIKNSAGSPETRVLEGRIGRKNKKIERRKSGVFWGGAFRNSKSQRSRGRGGE